MKTTLQGSHVRRTFRSNIRTRTYGYHGRPPFTGVATNYDCSSDTPMACAGVISHLTDSEILCGKSLVTYVIIDGYRD